MFSVFWVFFLQLFQIFSELCWTSVYQVWRFVSFTTNTSNWRQHSSYIWGCFSLFRGGFSWLSVTKSHHQPKFHYLLRENSPPYFHFPSPASKNRLLRTGNGERGLWDQMMWVELTSARWYGARWGTKAGEEGSHSPATPVSRVQRGSRAYGREERHGEAGD